jgi:hypothetical protein
MPLRNGGISACNAGAGMEFGGMALSGRTTRGASVYADTYDAEFLKPERRDRGSNAAP